MWYLPPPPKPLILNPIHHTNSLLVMFLKNNNNKASMNKHFSRLPILPQTMNLFIAFFVSLTLYFLLTLTFAHPTHAASFTVATGNDETPLALLAPSPKP